MKDVLYIVVHCTATRLSQRVTIDDIDRWHKARGFAQIGYHWYIDREGTIHQGRSEKLAGAHVRHYNQHALGVCYEGGLDEKGKPADTRTPEQIAALWFLLEDLRRDYPNAKIVGHRDFPPRLQTVPLLQRPAGVQLPERLTRRFTQRLSERST